MESMEIHARSYGLIVVHLFVCSGEGNRNSSLDVCHAKVLYGCLSYLNSHLVIICRFLICMNF